MEYKKTFLKNSTIDYISGAETNLSAPTIFVLGTVTSEDMLIAKTIFSQSVGEGEIRNEKKLVEGYLHLCRAGLKEIKNMIDFTWAGWNEEAKSMLCETGLVFELGKKILDFNTVGAERKN